MRYFLLLIILVLCANLSAQDGLSIQPTIFYGNYISHKGVRSAEEKPHIGFSLDISKKTDGKNYWSFAHDYPQMGLLITYRSLGNYTIYGNAFSILPYLEFDIWRSRLGILQLKHGTGLALVNRRYDPHKNLKNELLSTYINATSIIDLGFRFKLFSEMEIKMGGILHHISNGGFQKPNYGVNTAAAYLNYTYYLRAAPDTLIRYASIVDYPKYRFRINAGLGIYKIDYRNIVVMNPQIAALFFYQHNSRFRTGLGLEYGEPFGYRSQLAIYMEEEVQFNHLVTKYGFGGYLFNKRRTGEDFYSKIGIAYYPKTIEKIPVGFYYGLMMKAHRFSAAHIEAVIGFTF